MYREKLSIHKFYVHHFIILNVCEFVFLVRFYLKSREAVTLYRWNRFLLFLYLLCLSVRKCYELFRNRIILLYLFVYLLNATSLCMSWYLTLPTARILNRFWHLITRSTKSSFLYFIIILWLQFEVSTKYGPKNR